MRNAWTPDLTIALFAFLAIFALALGQGLLAAFVSVCMAQYALAIVIFTIVVLRHIVMGRSEIYPAK